MKKVDKKLSSCRYFLYFCIAVDIDGVFKNLQIMNHSKNRVKFVFPNPVDHYCDNIKSRVHFTLESLAVNPSNFDAFNNGRKTIDACINDLDKLRSYLDLMKDIISDEMPLPF